MPTLFRIEPLSGPGVRDRRDADAGLENLSIILRFPL